MDRQTAADLLDNLIGMVDDNQGNDYDTALKMGIEALKADVQPHGRWVLFDGYYCSNCNYKLQTTGMPTYCPHCGAIMER